MDVSCKTLIYSQEKSTLLVSGRYVLTQSAKQYL
jgi:hypothetical protein